MPGSEIWNAIAIKAHTVFVYFIATFFFAVIAADPFIHRIMQRIEIGRVMESYWPVWADMLTTGILGLASLTGFCELGNYRMRCWPRTL